MIPIATTFAVASIKTLKVNSTETGSQIRSSGTGMTGAEPGPHCDGDRMGSALPGNQVVLVTMTAFILRQNVYFSLLVERPSRSLSRRLFFLEARHTTHNYLSRSACASLLISTDTSTAANDF